MIGEAKRERGNGRAGVARNSIGMVHGTCLGKDNVDSGEGLYTDNEVTRNGLNLSISHVCHCRACAEGGIESSGRRAWCA